MKLTSQARPGKTEPEEEGNPTGSASGGGGLPTPLRTFCWFAAALSLAYAWVLVPLARYAAGEELHSHILLIPFVSAYLIYEERRKQAVPARRALTGAVLLTISGLVALAVALATRTGTGALSGNDSLSVTVFSWLCLLAAGGFVFLGTQGMRAFAFPFGFLLFMVPLPDAAVNALERMLMAASAEATEGFFSLMAVPHLRDGQVFQIPGITLQVAQECSGIRSSLVLFITSLVASYLFLRSPWRRALFVAVVIPLGILRNGFRILVLGMLCVRYGPHMIDSDLHHRGGPVFFALSLIPLFLLLWWLRKGETRGEEKPQTDGRAAGGAPPDALP